MNIAVIGGGAAGFFAAINCASKYPKHSVTIFEKSGKLLSKVRISGGGRCNVTHACFENSRLIEFYPRGKKELRNAFSRFSTNETVQWFESRGVKLKTEEDGRMFPVSNSSESIIRCLMDEVTKNDVKIEMNFSLNEILKTAKGKFKLQFQNGNELIFDRVIITSGGNANLKNYNWIEQLGHKIIPPVPSLFTFNIPGSPLKGLEGISSIATVKLEGLKLESTGPVLITHWGISGPAVLRLSSFAARWLHDHNYTRQCFLNWIAGSNEEDIRQELFSMKEKSPNKKISLMSFHGISSRLWLRLNLLSDISGEDKFSEGSKAKLNKLVQNICRMPLRINGKTTFKEEFVTCGGVDLKEINMQTMESKKVNGLYFAGEVLDIDGVTGGFNFQSAWTTGFVAGMNAGE